ncbi:MULTISPECIES: hypothetical protein [Cyanophyceae]|uniref:hypothetical protein n=1 Tax=Cyanophyceae TaxID=3028117 RepID=UPI00168A2805|nr:MULTISPECIES: hypothetical protein [Cyanophyceae]MBD1918876.1 hypothetical protein [Phormidium sp. FACHB-77]MBD2033282.1 hypothetical protein [Phormidium sp. FACHB-322]MBD2053785.1 hypothetical protein [Leptolyngbya sp. FACHB-60]
MQHTTQSVILQSAGTMPIPDVGSVEQFGLIGVMGFLVLKEVLAWWRGKESAEDQLLASLVSDLRSANQSLIDKLFTMQAQQHKDQSELRAELRGLCERIDKLL